MPALPAYIAHADSVCRFRSVDLSDVPATRTQALQVQTSLIPFGLIGDVVSVVSALCVDCSQSVVLRTWRDGWSGGCEKVTAKGEEFGGGFTV